MKLISSSRESLLGLVIKFLVIDFYCSTKGHEVTAQSIISTNEGHSMVVPRIDTDIDTLLTKLKSELAKDDAEDASYAYCYGEENCTGGQYCHVPSHQCACDPSTYVEETCPTVGMRCKSCCCGRNVYCTGDICELYEIDVVSSQMILSIVMVMGLVSIIFMVYRMCYRNSLQQRLLHSPPRESPRPSISSLQIGVMSRMRDRPPLYETQHNYQTRNASSLATGDTIRLGGGGVDNPAMEVCEVIAPRAEELTMRSPPAIYINTPPPPYVSSTANNSDQQTPRTSLVRADPPSYSEAIKESTVEVQPQDSSTLRTEGGGQQQRDPLGNFKELYI